MTPDTVSRYESYKDSGIPWVGEIPTAWESTPGRACLYENKNKNTGMIESQVLSLSYGRVIQKSQDQLTGLVPESFETYQIVEPGDIIVRGTDLQNDVTSLRTGMAKDRGIITSAYINLRPKQNALPEFLHYVLHSYDSQKVFYGLGSGLRQNLSYDDFKYIGIPIPDLDTQNRVVSFLDEKMAEIDEAIKKKRRLIELLNEQKAILINRAVTKGLNPNAPMKDSGVHWIGRIPTHWKVLPLKRLATIDSGSTPDRTISKYWNGDIPWVKTGEVDYTNISETEEYVTREALRGSAIRLAPAGTVLVAMYGQGVTRGRAAILDVDATYNQACAAIKPTSELTSEFILSYFIGSYTFIREDGNETSQMNLSTGYISNLLIPIPPKIEQVEISKFVRDTARKMDDATTTISSGIQALDEFKQTLIANAVTGKIKV